MPHRSLPLFILIAICPVGVIAKDSANLPAEVVEGWQRLAKASHTFCILLGETDVSGKNKYDPGVLSRFDDRYAKLEILQPDGNKENWRQRIKEVLLFDGEEYLTLERPKGSDAFALAAVGNNRALYRILSVDAAPSTSAFYYDLLQAWDSTTETFTEFERRSGHDEGVYATMKTTDLKKSPPSEIVVKLDPAQDYRVMSATQILSTVANYRNRTEHHYGKHPALPSETLVYGERQERGTGNWISADAGYPYTTRRELLKDVQLTAKHFTLEHYGVPPFRKRQASIWPTVAAFVGGLLLVIGGVYWYRCRFR